MPVELMAKKIRIKILEAILKSKASHIASAFSIVDILTILYGNKYVNPLTPNFILSKGHAGVAVYATLNVLGIISDDMFNSYYTNGSYLGGHVSHKKVPGVYLSTGSLGGGISVANGICLANKINQVAQKIYVIIGDGECNEGSIWEGALFAAHHKLNNLVVVIDRNRLQGCGTDSEIINLGNLLLKWHSFGWHAVEVNGHNYSALDQALNIVSDLPLCIIANTTKGKGASFMEHNNLWHYRNVAAEDYNKALLEIGQDI